MNLTLAEITAHRTRLRQEIMEREIVLAAFAVVEKYAASGDAPKSMRLDSLVSALLPSKPTLELKETSMPATPAPAALPPAPPPEPYIHPELKHANFRGHGVHSNLVRWAIDRMTNDYSLHDISALLAREGAGIGSPEISVVLTRLKARGEIEEIRRSAGPKPAIFRKPESAVDEEEPQPDTPKRTPTEIDSMATA